MSEKIEIDYLLTVTTEPTYNDIRKVESSVFRILDVIKRATGSESIAGYIDATQRMISMTRSAIIAIHALEIASGPVSWLYAGTSIIATGLLWADSLSGMEARR